MDNKFPDIGSKWLCIRDVVINDTDGDTYTDILYFKNKIYWSEETGCITNEDKYKYHYWNRIDDINKYFIRLPRNKKSSKYENYRKPKSDRSNLL